MFFFLSKIFLMFSIFLSRSTPKRSDIDSSLDNEEDGVDLLLSPIMPPKKKSKIQHASAQCSPCTTPRGRETEPEENTWSSGSITRTPLKHEAKNAEQRSRSPNSSRPGPPVKKISFHSEEHDTPPTWQERTSKSNMAGTSVHGDPMPSLSGSLSIEPKSINKDMDQTSTFSGNFL